MEIDYECLRNDLLCYFGGATKLYPMAIIDYCKVENATNNELIEIATNNGFDISNYKIYRKTKR